MLLIAETYIVPSCLPTMLSEVVGESLPYLGKLKSGECIHRERTCVLSLRRGLAISELSGKFIAFNHSLTVH